MPDKPKISIANRKDGGVLYWTFKLYCVAFVCAGLAAGVTGVLTYRHFANMTPPVPDLASYTDEAPAVTRLFAGDGTLLAEFADERREFTPYEQFPQNLINAFVAVEDHDFFDHRGLYFKGIARAAWANFVAGDFAQGGSTITQQVAKQFLSSEKSLTRKAKEAIMARRLEARYSKRAILSLYMNHIYLGAGAYGVAAAARRYFSKRLDELTIGEMAVIAGLAKAPSSFSPLRSMSKATARRDRVLDDMAKHGFLPLEEAEHWKQQPIVVRPYKAMINERMPYFSEHLRKYVKDKYGIDTLMKGGLTVHGTVQPVVDGAAAENVFFNSHKQDKRQGWRGPEWFVEGKARETFVARMEEEYGDRPLEPERRYLGLIETVRSSRAEVRVGANVYRLPLDNMDWASKWKRLPADNDIIIEDARRPLDVGDVIWVSLATRTRGKFRDWFREGLNPRWHGERKPRKRDKQRTPRLKLEQVAHPQGAIFTADHTTGYVVAMAGGNDFSRSELNRATQACRQPASTYKPIVYSAALNDGYGYDSLFNDVPRKIIDPVTGEEWIPTNIDGSTKIKVTLQYALVFSKNVPSVAIFEAVGAKRVEAWARKLGFSTKIIADKALALGASCTKLHELTRAFAIFARNGKWIDWSFVRRIEDRNGEYLEDNTVYYDPMLTPAERLDRAYATGGIRPEQAIPERAAYLTSRLLSQAVAKGFTSVVRRTKIHAAGKTGTSSAEMDVTFVAYTSRWITSVWLGDDDRVRPLGEKAAAYRDVVPLWGRYMYEVASEHPNREIPWEIPAGSSKRDRGDHSKGEEGEPMPLVKKKILPPSMLPPVEGAVGGGGSGI